MKGKHNLVPALLLGLALTAGLACQGGNSAADAQRQAAWSELQELKGDLDASRTRLAEALAQQTAEPAADEAAAEGEAAEAEAAAPVDTAALEQEAQAKADAFGQKLVAFINADPMIEGQEPTPTQRAALDMYVEENLVTAREFIDKGGDYRQAIEIYQNALSVDPGNPALEQALAETEASRYMTAERFAQVAEGMSEEQVRAAVGQVNLRNVREYDEGARVAWFYPREEGSEYAAGVFFERQDDGGYTVYSSDFDAMTPEKTQQAQ
ncbi:MAG: hypothetical protein ACRD2Z_04670 [Thermoanaerobaculia bacterium]